MEPVSPDLSGRSHLPTGQQGLHPDLEAIVRRHLSTVDRTPIPEHTRVGYEALAQVLKSEPRPIMLDSGCGTATGTAALAKLHPEAWVVGIDRSTQRLRKGPAREDLRKGLVRQDNLLVLRADVPSVWRLLAQDGLKLQAHDLLYPNPYPKRRHVMRRWHAHPAFAALCSLGGRVQLRTNWKVYADEMALALQIAAEVTQRAWAVQVRDWAPFAPQTKFEAKYLASGHPLFQVIAEVKG